MNEHVCDELRWDDQRRYDRGKVLSAEQLDQMERYGRYLDVDGDGITYRTIPGVHPEKGAFFNRGTSRDEYAIYTENGDIYERNMARLLVKWATAPKYLPKPVIRTRHKSADIGIIHFGTSMDAAHEAIDRLSAEGHQANDLRIRAFPFHQQVKDFIDQHKQIFVVEQNRDAQMKALIVTELEIDPKRMKSVLAFNGDPISARVIHEKIADVVNSKQSDLAQQG